jgi:hypothetical protein
MQNVRMRVFRDASSFLKMQLVITVIPFDSLAPRRSSADEVLEFSKKSSMYSKENPANKNVNQSFEL